MKIEKGTLWNASRLLLPITKIHSFSKSIVSLQQRVFRDKQRSGEGFRGGIQSPKVLNRGVRGKLTQVWTALHEGRMSVQEFLTTSSYICVERRTQYLHVYLEGHTPDEEPLELSNSSHQILETNSNDSSDDEGTLYYNTWKFKK